MTSADRPPSTQTPTATAWRSGRLDVVVVGFSVAIVLVAPFMGVVRDALFELLGPEAVPRLGKAIALGAGLVIALGLAAVLRGPRRWVRLALLAAAGGVALLSSGGLSTGHAATDVVEQIHIFEYGGLALLVWWADRQRFLRATGRAAADGVAYVLPVLVCALVAVLDEGTQWFFQLRVGEIRDVALDVTAACAGLLAAMAILPAEPSAGERSVSGRLLSPQRPPERRRHLLRLAAITAALLGVFLDVAHLGHWVVDPEIGRFRSHMRSETLRAVAAERAARWAVDPPRSLAPHHPEDRFLSEAARHAQHRNERLAAGDATLALHANRLLERWYDPFLDLESFRGSGRHRWTPEQQRDIAARASAVHPEGVHAETYVSPVLAGRVWPTREPMRWLWRVAAFAVAAACWIASRRESA